MLRSTLLASSALLAVSSAALAADLPSRKEAVPPAPYYAAPAFTWTGFYFGANLGGAWGAANVRSVSVPQSLPVLAPFNQSVSDSGLIGGGQIGYNYQFGSLVVGVEADLQGAGLNGSSRVGPVNGLNGFVVPAGTSQYADGRINWFGTVRGRVGYAIDRALIYATGGLIYGGVHSGAALSFPSGQQYIGSASATNAGWTLGGGVEYAFTNNWTAKLEGLYYNLGNLTYTAIPVPANPPFAVAQKASFTGGLVRLGVNYKF